jgi:SAM-dependent methyltransferase
LPYADEYFDIVLSMNGYHVFPNKERAFSETARALKHGGMLCGCCYIRGEFARNDFLINRSIGGGLRQPTEDRVKRA